MSEIDDPEVEAIKTLLKVLTPLESDARANVLDFVFRKLGISPVTSNSDTSRSGGSAEAHIETTLLAPKHLVVTQATDIRSLREEKQPKTASQMAALVAYYLKNLAPDDERRDFITPGDVTRYFNQARFELPISPPSVTLLHAKNAGFLNQLDRGRYKLNPVGYNLVAYKLPGHSSGETTVKKSKAKPKRRR